MPSALSLTSAIWLPLRITWNPSVPSVARTRSNGASRGNRPSDTGLPELNVQDGVLGLPCLFTESLNVEPNSALHVGEGFLGSVAFADNDAAKAYGIRDETIRMMFNDDGNPPRRDAPPQSSSIYYTYYTLPAIQAPAPCKDGRHNLNLV